MPVDNEFVFNPVESDEEDDQPSRNLEFLLGVESVHQVPSVVDGERCSAAIPMAQGEMLPSPTRRRPSRRLVLVPGTGSARSQAFQIPPTVVDSPPPSNVLDALEFDLQSKIQMKSNVVSRLHRCLLLPNKSFEQFRTLADSQR